MHRMAYVVYLYIHCMRLIPMFTKWNEYISNTRKDQSNASIIRMCLFAIFVCRVLRFERNGNLEKNRCFIARMTFCRMKNRRLRLNHNLPFTMQTKFSTRLNILSLNQYYHWMQIITMSCTFDMLPYVCSMYKVHLSILYSLDCFYYCAKFSHLILILIGNGVIKRYKVSAKKHTLTQLHTKAILFEHFYRLVTVFELTCRWTSVFKQIN